MGRREARASVDALNRHLEDLGVYTAEALHGDGSAGVEYLSRAGRRQLATVERAGPTPPKWLAAAPLAVVAAVAAHAAAFAAFRVA